MQIIIETNKVIIDGVEYIKWQKTEESQEVKIEDNILNHSNLINLVKTFESFFICPPVIPGIIKPVAAKPILI